MVSDVHIPVFGQVSDGLQDVSKPGLQVTLRTGDNHPVTFRSGKIKMCMHYKKAITQCTPSFSW